METKTYKILRLLYFRREKVSSKEISQKVGIQIKQVSPYVRKLIAGAVVKKEKIGRYYHYYVTDYRKEYVRKFLERRVEEMKREGNVDLDGE